MLVTKMRPEKRLEGGAVFDPHVGVLDAEFFHHTRVRLV
jgi:hypothetical protein